MSRPFTLAVFTLLLSGPAMAADAAFEEPPVLRATDLMPASTLVGVDHRVDPRVLNDGLMNRYQVDTRFGSMSARSNAELAKRLEEITAIAQLEKMVGTGQFFEGLASAGAGVVEGATGLLTNPVGTVSGVISGVGTLFRRTGDSLTGDPRSQYEDDALKAVLGVSSAKRELAARLGVDPYSSNDLLQAALNTIARASAAGDLTGSVALAAVGGAAGTVVSIAGTTDNLNDLLRTTPPTDLRRRNRDRLESMGVGTDLVDLFLGNTVFSPTYQTLLVDALDRMASVAERGSLVKLSVRTDSDDLAMFRQRQARMYAAYHAKVQPIARFVEVGELAVAQTTAGGIVMLLPVDHLAWTANVARAADALGTFLDRNFAGATRELWLGGSVSALARQSLGARGWTIHEQQAGPLVGPG